ncbi:MAG: lipopolysaccharide biosynthesis protein RfbH [Candidatus Nanoarchaeia archaeon]
METKENIKSKILERVAEYYQIAHQKSNFVPGVSSVPYGGRVFDDKELKAAVAASLDFWLTLGKEGEAFEKEFADYLGVKHVILTNSGSSANLLAFAALTSEKLDNPIKPGDEVITVAAGFPTTVNPIIQYGCVPVFVDIEIPSFNIDVSQLEKALSPKTRAVMLAHTLGNPFDIDSVLEFCNKHGLWLIEDNCDALGSKYNGRYTGTFGHIATSSFYPPHHITMGEGGAVYTNDANLKKIVESFRDWGRDCWCASGKDNTCKKRFSQKFGNLPLGYDHKYVYSHIGYNLKPTDIQAAIGREQLKKLPSFIEARKRNWNYLREKLAELEKNWHFMEATPKSEPSWFGFLLCLKKADHDKLTEICKFLEDKKIGHRRLFGGNLLLQPAYAKIKHRKIDELSNSDLVANGAIFLGVYPGLSTEQLDYVCENLKSANTLKFK